MNLTSGFGIVGLASIATLATACLPAMNFPASDDAAQPAAAMIDEASILASVTDGRYRYSPQFVPVSGESYPSAVAAQSNINVWVTSADYSSYARITPDKTGSGATLAPGGMVIREVLDAKGAVGKLTLMVKGPAGYNPSLGDFWFGVTQPDGTPVVDNGAAKLGKMQDCFGCHTPRAADGFLFGVPQADRMRPGTVPGSAVDGGTPPTNPSDMSAHPTNPSDMGTTPTNPSDMGTTSYPDVCGDFICGASESCDSCASDCHCCGNGDRHGKSGGCNQNNQ